MRHILHYLEIILFFWGSESGINNLQWRNVLSSIRAFSQNEFCDLSKQAGLSSQCAAVYMRFLSSWNNRLRNPTNRGWIHKSKKRNLQRKFYECQRSKSMPPKISFLHCAWLACYWVQLTPAFLLPLISIIMCFFVLHHLLQNETTSKDVHAANLFIRSIVVELNKKFYYQSP